LGDEWRSRSKSKAHSRLLVAARLDRAGIDLTLSENLKLGSVAIERWLDVPRRMRITIVHMSYGYETTIRS
jgi:hypothetical protein